MVLLAAAVCNKSGKALISRQFIEMTRSRIEGLLASFPKLMGSGKQHTFVETDSVRYVYQPLEKLYMLLITTKASNILEDLETLRLFSRVIPEYCKTVDESQIVEQAFPLIFAFDEIVALGYRENVNLAQVRTFTEMDSHDEKVFLAVRQNQEKEASDNMKKRMKEIQDLKKDANRNHRTGYIGGGIGSNATKDFIETVPAEKPKPYMAPSVAKPIGGGKALKLKGKNDAESFVDQLKSEGEKVASPTTISKSTAQLSKTNQSSAPQESIHLRMEEKIILTAGRDGGLQNMEVHGLLTLKVTNEKQGRIKIGILNKEDNGIQLQTHPNVDKKVFLTESVIMLKNPEKPFPTNTDVGVLKWRLQTQDVHLIPLSINCWPNEVGNKCDVNIEYELERSDLQLNDVVITVPLGIGMGAPMVNDCEGEYKHDARRNVLEWRLPLIDSSNKTGTLEFSIGGHASDFFPVNVSFVSARPYCNINVDYVKLIDDNDAQKYSSEVLVYVDKYEII